MCRYSVVVISPFNHSRLFGKLDVKDEGLFRSWTPFKQRKGVVTNALSFWQIADNYHHQLRIRTSIFSLSFLTDAIWFSYKIHLMMFWKELHMATLISQILNLLERKVNDGRAIRFITVALNGISKGPWHPQITSIVKRTNARVLHSFDQVSWCRKRALFYSISRGRNTAAAAATTKKGSARLRATSIQRGWHLGGRP